MRELKAKHMPMQDQTINGLWISEVKMDDRIEDELSDEVFLKDLGDRLMKIPVSYGLDQFDTDRLYEIANKMKQPD